MSKPNWEPLFKEARALMPVSIPTALDPAFLAPESISKENWIYFSVMI